VLHKDLKPGNVLVQDGSDGPTVKLCDFGSGGVLDSERLEKLGITRMGFTKTATTATSATPLYVAPEIIAGQPSTVAADIYALGVMLYQIVVADFRRALAPGWELDVADALLREDIAASAAGDPSRRLADVAQVADRLRSLEERRRMRAAELANRQRVERTRRALSELRRVRMYALLLLGLSTIAAAGGIIAYKARNDALAATATAEAVSRFLTEDVFRMDSGVYRPSETSYEALLRRAEEKVSARLKDQPEAAAHIHMLLGRRYQEIGQFEMAARQYESAFSLFSGVYGEASDPALTALDRIAGAYVEIGRPDEAKAMWDRVRKLWELRIPPTDLAMLLVRTRIARGHITIGLYDEAERELRRVIQQINTAGPSTLDVAPLFKQWLGINPPSDSAPLLLHAYANLLLGNVLEEVGNEHQEVELKLRDSLAIFSTTLGSETELSAITSFILGTVLTLAGDYKNAEAYILRTREVFEKSLPPRHFARGISKMTMGRLRIEQQRFTEAAALMSEAVDLCTQDAACPPRVRAEFLWDLGRSYREAGNRSASELAFRSALGLQERLLRSQNVVLLRTRVGLAETLREADPQGALTVLSSTSDEAIASLKPFQLAKAELRRVQGLLYLQSRDFVRARAALSESLQILIRRYGSEHWRTKRAQSEMAKLPPNDL
jgi:tetratricopeptide (TPR) repeat protein